MRVVVIGGTGNVGTSLVRALVADPSVSEVRGVARRVPTGAPASAKLAWVAADIASANLDVALAAADAVVHLAWAMQPSHRPAEQMRTNIVGTERLLEGIVAHGVATLVYASSVGAYATGPDDHPVDEGWPTHGIPHSPYSQQKAYVERMLDTFEARHPDVRVVRMRPTLLLKQEAASELHELFLGPVAPRAVLRPGLVRVIGKGPARFQVLHTDDAAGAFRRALHAPVRGAFNLAADPVIGTGAGRRLLEPAMTALAGAAWRLRFTAADPGWVSLVFQAPLLDPSRARDELGWEPERRGDDVIAEVLTGMRDRTRGPTPALAG